MQLFQHSTPSLGKSTNKNSHQTPYSGINYKNFFSQNVEASCIKEDIIYQKNGHEPWN